MSDDREFGSTEEIEEKEEEGKEIDPDLLLGDEVAVDEEDLEDEDEEEDEEGFTESDLNPFGDKWEE